MCAWSCPGPCGSSHRRRADERHAVLLHRAIASNDFGEVLDILPLPRADGTDDDTLASSTFVVGRTTRLPPPDRTVAFLDDPGPSGLTALELTCSMGNEAIARFLLDSGATPSSLALEQAVDSGVVALVGLLLRRGCSPNSTTVQDIPMLVRAAGSADTPMIRVLVEHGADLSVPDPDSYTALHHCSRNGCLAGVQLLLKAHDSSILSIRNHQGRSALHHACKYGHLPIVRGLVEAGADLDAKDQFGATAAHLAASYARLDILEYLYACGADRLLANPLPLAVAAASSDPRELSLTLR